MNRIQYFNYIEEKLHTLATRINSKGKLNILDLHNHSEDFYLYFFNMLFDWNLENLNNRLHNVEAIDLIDRSKKIILQISATNTKNKIETALQKDIIKTYKSYNFKFVSISKEANNLKNLTFNNIHGVTFCPNIDIYDIVSILSTIKSLGINKQQQIYQFIKDELGSEIDIVKLDSNLAIIIDILSKEDLNSIDTSPSIDSFEIERKIQFNNLVNSKLMIDDYSNHSIRLDLIYREFDKNGVNKSYSVLQSIRKIFSDLNDNNKKYSADKTFEEIIKTLIIKVKQSSNFKPIPIDELELCVNIIVVDSFIRCKIFNNPKDYKNAFTR